MRMAMAMGAAAAWLAAFAVPPASAAGLTGPPQSLHDALFPPVELGRVSPGGMPPPPPVARYRSDVGDSFVIDRLGRDEALLRLDDGGGEVWALRGVPAGHGDMVFKNDVGESMLRVTRWGGMTLFTPSHPLGMAAALDGSAVALHANGSIGPQALGAIMAQASARAGRAAGRLVAFDAQGVPGAFDWLFADAAQLAADAFTRAAQEGRRVLVARFSEVRLTPGRAPAVVAVGAMVLITVAPDRGVAGRPSSRRSKAAVERR